MNRRDDPAEIEERKRRVLEAHIRARVAGHCSASPDELTAALGDECGIDHDARRRAAKGTRKRHAAKVRPRGEGSKR